MSFFTVDFGVNFANERRYPIETIETIMQESWAAGVDKVVCISNSFKESKRIIAELHKFENMYFTLGVHPHNANKFSINNLGYLEKYASGPKCFAIGEIGLDYDRNFSSKEQQIFAFVSQVDFAKKCGKKMYLHCRDVPGQNYAFNDFIKILKERQYFNGLVHCFTGTYEEAREFTELGLKLGITGWLLDTRRNKNLIDAVKRIPLDSLLVETDAPYMPIHGQKESRPIDTAFIVEKIAELKKIDVIECGNTVYQNSLKYLANN